MADYASFELILPNLIVSRETEAKLRHLVRLVEKWTAHINLVSGQSLGDIWDRHVLDSAQIFEFIPANARHLTDFGSGGGFPGLVIAIIAEQRMPDLKVTLVESDLRKATFLRTAARELSLVLDIRTSRIEATEVLGANVVTARALGPLPQLLGFASRHLSLSGTALFMKGRAVEPEIEIARRNWRFDLTMYPSKTDPEARILKVENIEHV